MRKGRTYSIRYASFWGEKHREIFLLESCLIYSWLWLHTNQTTLEEILPQVFPIKDRIWSLTLKRRKIPINRLKLFTFH